MVLRAALALLLGMTLVAAPLSAQRPSPTVEGLLRAATDYLASYAGKVSGVSLEEEYTIIDVSGGRMRTPQRLNSDVILLNLAGKVIALRDAYAIDSKPLRERRPRITALLVSPTETAWQQAQDYATESFRHLRTDLIMRLNEPTLALQFIAPEQQRLLKYKVGEGRALDGVETVGLVFEEPANRDASYIISTRGKAAAKGWLWIDPATGRIHQTELWMQSETETARVTVTYAREPKLDLWLPARMVETYDTTESRGEVSIMGVGNYNIRQSFQCRAIYSNARLTPIELAVVK